MPSIFSSFNVRAQNKPKVHSKSNCKCVAKSLFDSAVCYYHRKSARLLSQNRLAILNLTLFCRMFCGAIRNRLIVSTDPLRLFTIERSNYTPIESDQLSRYVLYVFILSDIFSKKQNFKKSNVFVLNRCTDSYLRCFWSSIPH